MLATSCTLSSRHRNDMVTIFDVFCELGFGGGGNTPTILTKYPDDYDDPSVLKSIQQFSFPCDMIELDSEAVQHFSFVLTDAQSKYTFGHCRYTPRNNTCICILSGFAWPEIFFKVLNHLSLLMNKGTQTDLDTILTQIYHTDIPLIGTQLSFAGPSQEQKLVFDIPDLTKLPTLKEDKFMLEFFSAVSPKQMLAIYASLLKERRIIFTGRKLRQLSSCIYAAATLLYPMTWQSIFVPVLPEFLMDMIMAPMPFLIGVPKPVLAKCSMKDMGDVMIVDLDEKSLQSSHDDVAVLPNEVANYLKSQLKGSLDMGDSLARTFLRANVMLFGGYRMGFVPKDGSEEFNFDKEHFVKTQRSSVQEFLSSLIGVDGVQYLERFLDEKLKSQNLGLTLPDEFEREIVFLENKRSQNQESLQEVVQSVKDNANDVFGALKEKVSGIQIGAKLNKLTPKEIRRNKNWSMKAKPTKSNGYGPMSFDNMQWQETMSAPDSGASSRNPSPQPSSVPTGNLIDFDSPPPVVQPFSSSNPFLDDAIFGSTHYHQSASIVASENRPPSLPAAPPAVSRVRAFADPFSPQSSSAPHLPTSANWEKFD